MVRSHPALTLGRLWILAVGLAPAAAQSPASTQPALDGVFPPGGRQGAVVEVSVRGRGLGSPARVLVSGPGVAVRAVRGVSALEARATLAISPDAAPGPRLLRLGGSAGLSDPAAFVIGTLPEAVEQEPNDAPAAATPVTPPVVVNGALGAGEDVDCYRFHARAGQPCVAAVEAFRLDSQVKAGDRWQFTVPVLEIRDAAGRLVAGAAEGQSFDPALCFTVPADGEYVAAVHDLAYLGGERAVYRLTLGDVPYPTAMLPAGGTRGERVTVRLFGLNLPSLAQAEVRAPVDAPVEWMAPLPGGRVLPFLASDLAERVEVEPNDRRPEPVAVPLVLNGSLGQTGDEDRFAVSLRRGEGVLVEVLAGRVLRSPVDLEVAVLDPAGRKLAENDDSPFTLEETRLQANSLSGDPRLEFTAPADGVYTLRLRDVAGRGGPGCVYRATVTRLEPGFSLSTRSDNPSLPGPGGSGAVFVTLRRWGSFTGPVRLRAVGLSPGFRGGEALLPAAGAGPVPETALVTVTAPARALPGEVVPFRVEGEAIIAGQRRVVAAEPQAPVGDNYRAIPFFRPTDTCTAWVLAPGELALRAAMRAVRGAPGDTVPIPITLTRGKGAAALTLVALRGHRAAFGSPVPVPAGAERFDFPLRIPNGLPAGEYSFVISPPLEGDFRWHRVDRCTESILLEVVGPAAAPQPAAPVPETAPARPAPVPAPAVAALSTAPAAPRPPAGGPERRGAISFVNDVMPVLTRAGCSQGTCHGARVGRGGLRLSLLGFDPEVDFAALVHEAGGRRICRAQPGASLLLRKPAMLLPHGGGLRLPPGSAAYQVLARWLAQGAPGPAAAEPRVVSVSVLPRERRMRRGERLPLRVLARFSDGERRDVTSWARFSSNQPGVAGAAPEGLVMAGAPGEAVVLARYQGQVGAVTVSVPFSPPRGPASSMAAVPESWVDTAIRRQWEKVGLVPSGDCTDTEFVRRVYLDAIATLPSPAEVETFLEECAAERRRTPGSAARARARLVDRLLERPEWVDYWALYFGDLLRNNREVVGDNPMWAFRAWLQENLRREKPLPRMLRELIEAPGSLRENPALSYYSIARTPEELAETTSQVLLGVRLQCAKCHDHPFEPWTQSDYYAFAAFFARVRTKGFANLGKFGGDMLVLAASEGEVRHPKTEQAMRPRPLAGRALSAGDENRLGALAAWLGSPDNPFVARSLVNRIWARLMGRGLVEPVDDFRSSNPPTHPELLAALASDFAAHGYRLKHLMRRILTSRAYQLSSRPTRQNAADDRFYSRYYVRRLGAEQLLDALSTVTGVPERFGGVPAGTRAIALPDNLHGSYFLELFGRPARLAVCECERDSEPNLTQTLHLLNGNFLQERISAEPGRVARLLREGAGVTAVMEELYRAAYARAPTSRERAAALRLIAEAPTPREGLEDLLWTLLNSREFLLNH